MEDFTLNHHTFYVERKGNNMNIEKLVIDAEEKCQSIFKEIDENEYYFSKLILDTFHEENINESHFTSTTGYGSNDSGREAIERVFARVLKGESA